MRAKALPLKANVLEELRAEREQWKQDHPIIRSEYRVVEFTPAWRDEDDYGSGTYVSAVDHDASEWFDSIVGATRFMKDHKPDHGRKFRVEVRDLRYMPPVPATEKWFTR